MVKTLFNLSKLAPQSALFTIHLGRQTVPLQRKFLGEQSSKRWVHHLICQNIQHPRFKLWPLHAGLIGTQATPTMVTGIGLGIGIAERAVAD
jgi:hypothetical protein